MLRLAILISGGGRTLVNLHERIIGGTLPARIDVVVSSQSHAKGVERARALGLPTVILDHKCHEEALFHDAVTDAVRGVDLVCMAGFVHFWRIPDSLLGRVINIHPALLPEFGGMGMYGMHVHRAVIAAGRTESGCTVHFCDNEYDHGPIILQRRVPVLRHDQPEDLAGRVFEAECVAYPAAIRRLS
ncbi:MAG: phosphoribosylglycinamide formyltransferase [Planctomycetota bacterium]